VSQEQNAQYVPGATVGRGVRVRTVVLGLAAMAASASVLVGALTHARLDGTVLTLAVMIGAGAALLAGGIAAAVREARGGPGA
jgi:hypothetical protein